METKEGITPMSGIYSDYYQLSCLQVKSCITAVFGVNGLVEWRLWLTLEGICLGGVDVGPNSAPWLWVPRLFFSSYPRVLVFRLPSLKKKKTFS